MVTHVLIFFNLTKYLGGDSFFVCIIVNNVIWIQFDTYVMYIQH